MATSWVTESSLRSWWALPAARVRSESTCFRRISARTPLPIPAGRPPQLSTTEGKQSKAKARLFFPAAGPGELDEETAAAAAPRPPAASRLCPLLAEGRLRLSSGD